MTARQLASRKLGTDGLRVPGMGLGRMGMLDSEKATVRA
jgi:hypothetical protein